VGYEVSLSKTFQQ